MALISTLSAAIDHYTGLSPVAFFTILALMVGDYLLVSSLFVFSKAKTIAKAEAKNDGPPPPPTKPVQMSDVTLEELKAFDGSNSNKPLLMANKGIIFDVSVSRMFYEPGGPYALFAGRDASRALALISFNADDLAGNLDGLSSSELEVLHDWEYKFMEKYIKVSRLVSEKIVVFVLSSLQQIDHVSGQVSTLVLCHTRELAYQICHEFERFSTYVTAIKVVFYEGVNITKHKDILRNECPHVVIGTPGRILALSRYKDLSLKNVRHFILDECDKMLESLDMRRDVQDIFQMTPHDKQVMIFLATLDKEIHTLCKRFMQDPMEIYVDDEIPTDCTPQDLFKVFGQALTRNVA